MELSSLEPIIGAVIPNHCKEEDQYPFIIAPVISLSKLPEGWTASDRIAVEQRKDPTLRLVFAALENNTWNNYSENKCSYYENVLYCQFLQNKFKIINRILMFELIENQIRLIVVPKQL